MAASVHGTNDQGGEDYFLHVRSEIADLLPHRVDRILEIGCSSGATLRWLKTRYPESHTTGIDGFAANRASIQAKADAAIIADLNEPLPDLGRFDLVLALDVLEHLRDADAILEVICKHHLTPGGAVIVSVPAISHVSVSIPLLFGRKFPYADAGILDRTHLRFFVETSSVAMMNKAGLTVDKGLLGGLAGRKVRLFNTLTGGLFKHWLTKQYIVRGVPSGVGQSAVGWQVAHYGQR